MGDGNLDCLYIQFLGEIERALYGFLRLSGQTNDEVPVDLDSNFLAVLRELPRHLDGRALLDVL